MTKLAYRALVRHSSDTYQRADRMCTSACRISPI